MVPHGIRYCIFTNLKHTFIHVTTEPATLKSMFKAKQCLKVAVTGAAGQIGYSLLPLIASGQMLGPARRIQLNLLDIKPAMKALEAVQAELSDCAFPLVEKVLCTHEAKVAFDGVDIAILCGSFPLKPGMVRKDLLQHNAKIMTEQGRALGEVAAPDCRVCLVANPVNTNALLVLKASEGKLNPKHVTALTRLDYSRATSFLAARANARVEDVRNCVIWGNHSATQVPDVNNATVKGIPARTAVKDDAFFDGEFVSTVQMRGFEILKMRGSSSVFSPAKATVDHVRDWILGTQEGTYVSMAVHSDGNPYGFPGGLIFSFPVTCSAGEWSIVPGLNITPHVAELIQKSVKDLEEERALAFS